MSWKIGFIGLVLVFLPTTCIQEATTWLVAAQKLTELLA